MKFPPHILLIAIVLLLPAALIAQRKGSSTARFTSDSSTVIPLDIDNNIIRMKVRVNGSRPLTMIFDTGADMTAIDERFVKELGLKTTSDILDGKGTGGNFTGSYIKSSTLSVDGVEVMNQPLGAFKIPTPPGFEFDGIIGYHFIAPFVVEIDYEKKTMTLTDPAAYRYRGKGVVVPLDLKGRDTPLLAITLRSGPRLRLAANVELDTGADGAFLLGGRFVEQHSVLRYFKHGTESVSRGAGGEQGRLIVTFDQVSFSGIKFNKPPVGLSLGKAGSDADPLSDGVVGGEILHRFKVIIDYSRSRMILERNKAFNEPYENEDSE